MPWIGNLVASREKWPERSECIRAFPFYPLTAALELEASLGIIIVQDEPGDVLERAIFRDVAGLLSNDYGEFHFPVHLRAVARNNHIVIWSRERRGGLEEYYRLFRNLESALDGVLVEVGANADDFARPADWRAETHRRIHAWSGRNAGL